MSSRLPSLTFALVFLLGLGGAVVAFWRYLQVRDEVVASWDGPGREEIRLEPGLYRVWLRQDPPGDEADLDFEGWWKQGWRLAPVELADGGEVAGTVQYGPLNGTTVWRDEVQLPVSVGSLRVDRPQRIRFDIDQANPHAPKTQRVQLWLARASYAQRNRLLLVTLTWFAGGLLGSCLAFAIVAGLQTPAEGSRQG